MHLFPTDGRPDTVLGRFVVGRPRLLASLAAGVIGFVLLETTALPLVTRLLLAWNVGTWLYIGLYLAMIATSDERVIRWRARITDEGQFLILVLASLAAVASLAAIFAELSLAKDLKGSSKDLALGLSGATVLSAWVFIHLTFALHYAHEYFDETKAVEGEKPTLRGGINFPDTEEPGLLGLHVLLLHYRRGVADGGREHRLQGHPADVAGALDPGVLLQQRDPGPDDQHRGELDLRNGGPPRGSRRA